MKLDDEIIELRRWDVVRVAPEVIRAMEGGEEGLELIAIGGPRLVAASRTPPNSRPDGLPRKPLWAISVVLYATRAVTA